MLFRSGGVKERAKSPKDTDTWVQPLARIGADDANRVADRDALRARLAESVSVSIDTSAYFDLSMAASFGEGNAILSALCARLLADASTSGSGIGERADRLRRALADGGNVTPAFNLLEELHAETGDPIAGAILAVVLWQATDRGGSSKERALELASASTSALPDDPLLLYCHGVMAFGMDQRTEAAGVLARALEVGLESDEAAHAGFLLDDLINFGCDGSATQADEPG